MLKICLLLATVTCVSLALMDDDEPLIGGPTKQMPADAQIQGFVDQVKDDIRAKAPGATMFKAVSYRSQAVNGINYFVKIRVADKDYVHVRIYRSFRDDGVTLVRVQTGKTMEDPINYF